MQSRTDLRWRWRARGTAGLLGLAVLAGCHAAPEQNQDAPPLPVEAALVTTAAASEGDGGGGGSSTWPATFARDREARLSLRLGGVLAAMPARIGEHLPRGALVARIDATPQHAAAARSDADVTRLTADAARNEALLAAGAISQAERDTTRAALTAARAGASASHYDDASGTLRMPFAGTILTREAEQGETVAPGQVLVSIADTASPLIARAAVSEAGARALSPGMPAQVQWGDTPSMAARILRIGGAAGAATGTVEVDLALSAPRAITSGALGSVTFAANRAAPAVQRIPAEALLDAAGGGGHVFVISADNRARRLAIRVLGIDGDLVRVAGLPAEARVITAGAGFVAEGQRVTIAAK